jgi:hypothetical protein
MENFATTEATDSQLKQCLVAGFITDLFQGTRRLTPILGDRHLDYNACDGSNVMLHSGFALGRLRTITPKNPMERPFTIVEKLTDVSLSDLMELVKVRPALADITERRDEVSQFRAKITIYRKLFGVYELPAERYESTLTAEELREKEFCERDKNVFRQRLSQLNHRREELGMSSVRFTEDGFRLGYTGPQYVYTIGDVLQAEQDCAHAVEQRCEAIKSRHE